jgi:hypothetical protein
MPATVMMASMIDSRPEHVAIMNWERVRTFFPWAPISFNMWTLCFNIVDVVLCCEDLPSSFNLFFFQSVCGYSAVL